MRQPSPPSATLDLFGSKFVCYDCSHAANWLIGELAKRPPSPLLLVHINIHNLRAISEVNLLTASLQTHAAFLLEGIGLKTGCLLTKGWIPADTNGTDLFPAFLDRLGDTPCRLFLLGGTPNVVALSARRIKETWPNVQIVGYRDGYFKREEIPLLLNELCRAKPTLLLIGMGSPRQEELALEFLRIPGLRIVWTVGGLFDFISNRIPRAPATWRALRLEWLYRIIIEPARLLPRYGRDALWLIDRCIRSWLHR